MLTQLSVTHFAIIKNLSITFDNGFTTITGETGAGKSIILGALKLVLGERADYSVIDPNGEKCVVEAVFKVNESFQPLFEKYQLDYFSETIVRREVYPQGRSRAFVNDVPTTLDVLQDITSKWIDIHSQFDTQDLLQTSTQYHLLDSYGEIDTKVSDYQKIFNEYTQLNLKINERKKALEIANQEEEYNTFLYNELSALPLDDWDKDELEQQLTQAENAEELIEQYKTSLILLNEEQMGMITQCRELSRVIHKIDELSSQHILSERIEGIKAELDDVLMELENDLMNIEISPEEWQSLKDNWNTINTLFQKHRVDTLEQLIEIRDSLGQQQNQFEEWESELVTWQQKQTVLLTELEQQAHEIHLQRVEYSKPLQSEIEKLLALLGMENAQIRFEFEEASQLTEWGKHNLQLLFSANKGIELLPIKKAVSGGERSRVMLALKKILAEKSALPTLILDEIDTGVSGRIAFEMGKIMHDMGQNMQLISITHLPQVAARGNQHFKVVKSASGDTTQTQLIELNTQQRVDEIASLLSGHQLTDAAKEQAIALMQ